MIRCRIHYRKKLQELKKLQEMKDSRCFSIACKFLAPRFDGCSVSPAERLTLKLKALAQATDGSAAGIVLLTDMNTFAVNLTFNSVRQFHTRLSAKSAIYVCPPTYLLLCSQLMRQLRISYSGLSPNKDI